MGFHKHKITEFTHRITDLPDQPTLSPQELKQRFDSSPEELRRAHNAVCDEGERLSARVEGIITDTFGDTIDREMLSHELAAELDGKAEQTALAAETAAREQTDAELQTDVAKKCEVYFGTYAGDGKASQFINLGFTPKAVYLIRADGVTCESARPWYWGGLALINCPAQSSSHNIAEITDGGFLVYFSPNNYIYANESNRTMYYAAFR